jgi:hypothetical protein
MPNRAAEDAVRRTLDHCWQAKQPGAGVFLRAGIVQAHLRQLLEVEAGAVHVDAVVGRACHVQDGMGDALSGFAAIMTGEHAVDIGIIEGPVALASVQSEDVDSRNDDDPGTQLLAGMLAVGHPSQKRRQARQHEYPIQLIAVQTGDQRHAG